MCGRCALHFTQRWMTAQEARSMSFGQVMIWMREGQRVARAAWGSRSIQLHEDRWTFVEVRGGEWRATSEDLLADDWFVRL